ncbi:MAG: hydroxymethylglutaryl-CoA lyase [Rickettsiales bacterium]|nr:hydroxymethylglutaryl-CoA lyase [Rickettsiales bacterium]|tara:strand:- start:6992 stop:7903 length:912 start_codon:yes stop_codon:yes gene_type:complete
MLALPDSASIFEVGPRDGLQNEPTPIATQHKVELVERLSEAGLPYIEVSSFVDPRWIPQLSDAEQVFSAIKPKSGVRYAALVPNERGLIRAKESNLDSIAVFISASETHNRKNLNRAIDESLDNIAAVMDKKGEGISWVRGYISMVFGCPYEGEIPLKDVIRVALRLEELGVDQISLGDTVGYANPRQVGERLASIGSELSLDKIALHFHDTRGTALANIVAGLDSGVRIFDSAIGGLGGCPYAPGAAGNVATEDLVHMLEGMGVHTGVSLDALVETARFIEKSLEKTLPGRYLRATRHQCRN